MNVAGTGHRPNKLGGYDDDIYQRLVTLAMTYLEETRPKRVISGMALGWDQALAEAAVNRILSLLRLSHSRDKKINGIQAVS